MLGRYSRGPPSSLGRRPDAYRGRRDCDNSGSCRGRGGERGRSAPGMCQRRHPSTDGPSVANKIRQPRVIVPLFGGRSPARLVLLSSRGGTRASPAVLPESPARMVECRHGELKPRWPFAAVPVQVRLRAPPCRPLAGRASSGALDTSLALFFSLPSSTRNRLPSVRVVRYVGKGRKDRPEAGEPFFCLPITLDAKAAQCGHGGVR